VLIDLVQGAYKLAARGVHRLTGGPPAAGGGGGGG
jgi:hypothetical protein